MDDVLYESDYDECNKKELPLKLFFIFEAKFSF